MESEGELDDESIYLLPENELEDNSIESSSDDSIDGLERKLPEESNYMSKIRCIWHLSYYDHLNKLGTWDNTYYKVIISQNYIINEGGCKRYKSVHVEEGYNIFTSLIQDDLIRYLKLRKHTIKMIFNINESFCFDKILNTMDNNNNNDTSNIIRSLNDRIEQYKFLTDAYECMGIKSNSIIPMYHSTISESSDNIKVTGFINKKENRRLDNGYFGSGIYLTSKFNYALSYGQSNILLCLVIPGKVYPVTEELNSNNSLYGKPLKEGYNSHYVLLDNFNLGKPILSPSSTTVDELVIFDTKRILPLFEITFQDNIGESLDLS
jgi:hypothetical protein